MGSWTNLGRILIRILDTGTYILAPLKIKAYWYENVKTEDNE
jgi:hypothetical protein